jgi:hypothetical protein
LFKPGVYDAEYSLAPHIVHVIESRCPIYGLDRSHDTREFVDDALYFLRQSSRRSLWEQFNRTIGW